MKKNTSPLFVIGKNQDTNTHFDSKTFKTSSDAYEFALQFYHEDIDIYESLFIILLNNKLTTIGWAKISQGGICQSLCDIRIVAKYAIESMSTNVILVHNHPSGSITPSRSDIALTKKVKKALNLFDITLADHLIITSDEYYSFSNETGMIL